MGWRGHPNRHLLTTFTIAEGIAEQPEMLYAPIVISHRSLKPAGKQFDYKPVGSNQTATICRS